jgi:uncharacterized OB-fold protein
MSDEKLICHKCGREMIPMETSLEYLGHKMTHKFPKCPDCGIVYIPEEIVNGKIHEVETELEDK